MYYYIINPASGAGRINKIQDRLKTRLKNLGIAGEFVKSTGPSDIGKLVELGVSKGFNTIVAIGGDSTISEVINTIDKKEVALGIIPIGITNELATTLGITDWQSACTILAARKIEKLDLGKIKDSNGKSRYFVTSASLGFETKIIENKKLIKLRFPYKTKYRLKMLKDLLAFKAPFVKLELDDCYSVESYIFNVSISNGKFYKFMPKRTKPQDEKLDVMMMGQLSLRQRIKYFLSENELNIYPKISVFKTKNIKIDSKEEIPISSDGQIFTHTPITIEVANRKLKAIVSKERRF